MTDFTTGRWLLVALAILGLAVVAPVVSAHGTDSPLDEATPQNATAADWTAWMADHMGPGSVEWMESHPGVTVDEMGRGMADGVHGDHVGDAHGHYDRHMGYGTGC